jgi:hypothetical protein
MIKHPKNLQSADSAKLFLEELANLREEPAASVRFWKSYGGYFQPGAFRVSEVAESQHKAAGVQPIGIWSTAAPLSEADKSEVLREALLRMRNLLREAWGITDLRRKEWKLFQLREKFHQMSVALEEQFNEPPPLTGMDFALRYLLRVMHKARVCESPGCASRRYFLSDRKARRFCSDACAKPAQSQYKIEWWQENRERISTHRKNRYREQQKNKKGKRR